MNRPGREFKERQTTKNTRREYVNSVIRLFVRSLGCSSAQASVCSSVCVSGLFSCSSVCLVLLAIHGHKHVINNKI